MAAARSKAPNATTRRSSRQKEAKVEAKPAPTMVQAWPTDDKGRPMAQISFTASELIPTGQFANVVVGPVTVTKFVADENLADQVNELAEMVESDCIAEQRELVLASLQADVENQKK